MTGNSQHEEKLSYRMIQDEISAGCSNYRDVTWLFLMRIFLKWDLLSHGKGQVL